VLDESAGKAVFHAEQNADFFHLASPMNSVVKRAVNLPERDRNHPSNSVNSVREGRPGMGRVVEFLWKAIVA
jgi:hypothetical protein